MRTLSFLLLASGVASAADVYTQKPEFAPSVEVGVKPEAAPKPDTTWPARFAAGRAPLWIWGADPNKVYYLRKEFPGGATAGRVRVSADNHVVLFLNGQRVTASDDWKDGAEADVSKYLKPDTNVLVAEVRNDGGQSGFVMKLVLTADKGEPTYVVSDESWTASEKKDDPKGVAVKRVAKYGDGPWGNVLDGQAAAGNGRIPANTFVTLPGFKVEKLFTVPKAELGSWVCMTFDDKGRIIASDQDGKGLCRITPPKPGTNDETKVEHLKVNISAAQGLLYHNGTLFVVCNGGPGSGLYKVRDTDNDDQYDEVVRLKALQGGGEHGPHAVRLAPDGKSLYVICGNHTRPPENFTHSRVPRNWGEDLLLPRNWDANGHARGILAPGGYVARTDFDGKTWEVFTSGYRNPYDFAFNADGEMFVYDADMEWDMGMPWYRPTRVNHATSGSELGWRSGTGKWPSYFLDSLPAMVDIGPGSPVGVEFGYGTKFPAKYQKALYILDWTFGTIYAIHTEANGSTYKGVKEEFVSRTPLPLTDAGVGPDGALYFTIGGRGTQSELFRVTYAGKEPTAKVEYTDARGEKQRAMRRKLEALHAPAANPREAVAAIWPHLGDPDRFIQYSARVALEHQPLTAWQERVFVAPPPGPVGHINAVVALARQGDKSLQPKLLAILNSYKIDPTTPDEAARPFGSGGLADEGACLDLLRAYQLVFIRMGEPDQATAAAALKSLEPQYPTRVETVNREMTQVLVYLKSRKVLPNAIEVLKAPSEPPTAAEMQDLLARNRGYGGSIANMLKNAPDQRKLYYLNVLRNVKDGWTLEQRKAYFAALNEARTKSGGSSYQGFLNQIDNDAFANATDTDRLAIEAAGLRKPFKPKGELPRPVGPGRAWTVADLATLEPKLRKGRDFKKGQIAFAASRCVVCHRFGGDGGATGPDLTQTAGRFTLKDLSESIIEPSKVVSDQYRASIVTTNLDKTITGKLVGEVNGRLVIVTDPEDSTKVVEVPKSEVVSVKPSAVSLMPDKLIDTLNEEEVLDLLAYLLSRGDPTHPMFKK